MRTNLVFKIKDNTTGKFSAGGINPYFTRTGKIWNRKANLTSHLTQGVNNRWTNFFNIYENCNVITYKLTDNGMEKIEEQPVIDLLAKIKLKKDNKILLENAKKEKRIKKEKYNEFLKLKEEFGT